MSDFVDEPVQRIIQSPINFSKTKETHTFKKGKRFFELKYQGSKTFSYNLPSMKNQRSTSMGFGKKQDFILKHINPNSPFYENPKEFNNKIHNSPLFSFGIARKYYDKVIKNF